MKKVVLIAVIILVAAGVGIYINSKNNIDKNDKKTKVIEEIDLSSEKTQLESATSAE